MFLREGSDFKIKGIFSEKVINFNGNHTLSHIHEYTIKLYDEILPEKTGLPSSFHKTGSLRVGHTEVEEQWFRNIISRANHTRSFCWMRLKRHIQMYSIFCFKY